MWRPQVIWTVMFSVLAGAAIGYVLDQYRQSRRRANTDAALARARSLIGDDRARWREWDDDE